MGSPLRIDVASIDRTQFKVFEEEGEVLVIPLKDKFRWRDDELHLRSLVLDAEGNIVSAGFPKFFNLGENPAHDRELTLAMARGAVEFPEKLDGSLIVADRVGGVARLRTRGRRGLGEFGPEVEALVASRYPRLLTFLREDVLLETCSLLFEFVSPNRAIVVRHARAELFLLGCVDKRRVAPAWDAATLARVHGETGVAPAALHPLPPDLDGALAQVRAWKGREGVVARFRAEGGEARLIKIKAEDYLRLHAYRSRLSGARARKIAWLLDLRDESELLPALARHGLDWEAAEFARAEVVPYLARRREVMDRFAALRAAVTPWMGAQTRAEKRGYVERVRALLAAGALYAEPFWFTVAMKLFDASEDEARLLVDAAALDEHAPTLQAWRRDPEGEIRAILSAPVREEDG